MFVGAADPVGRGLVASLARPGGNITGASFAFEDGMGGTMIDLLREAVPKMSRLASLGDAAIRPPARCSATSRPPSAAWAWCGPTT